MIAVLENFQEEGGAVAVPEVLTDFGAPAASSRGTSTDQGYTPRRAGCPSGRKGRS